MTATFVSPLFGPIRDPRLTKDPIPIVNIYILADLDSNLRKIRDKPDGAERLR